ncbi:Lipoprotein NlpI precursor [Photobacterium piscicola]|uniref:Lipoprotein NlpI n=1 Tax=Photobacterium piscicola TaxID=1378299 RepID=A0A1T5I308_9GAMM|nr:lipoprotein NlpI [Photobacterium piscicola]SKC33484.1 Lipoprotein NlpI precursor [Photobacterium piscicola]
MIIRHIRYAVIATALVISGCSTAPTQWTQPPMAVPYQANFQQQIQLARIEQILQQPNIPPTTLATIYYDRGLLHDSLGLRDLARLDFNKSLTINPNQPDLFNVAGVIFTQMGMFDSAYESFDSTLDLAPEHPYAHRNRGIALYYGERYTLANEDLLPHYLLNINDPYRVIWLYINDLKYTPEQARTLLQQRYAVSDKKDWGWQIVRMYLGEITEEQFLTEIAEQSKDNQQLALRLTEGYFYLAQTYQNKQDYPTAVMLYKLALAGNVYEFVEHRFSILELNRIFTAEENAAAASSSPSASVK